MLRGGGESIVVVISDNGYGEAVVIYWDVSLSMATYTFIVYGLKW
jgi:hypothetical protein